MVRATVKIPRIYHRKNPTHGRVLTLVEHLEKSSSLIIEEVRRWHDLLRDNYLNYKYHEEGLTDVDNP